MIPHWRNLFLLSALALAASTSPSALASGSFGNDNGNAAATRPADPDFAKAEKALVAKDWPGAIDLLSRVVAKDTANADAYNYLGYMFADKGVRLPEALKLIRKAVDQEPMNGAYLDSLGWAYFKMGEYEMAEDNLRQAVERDRTDPTVHDHLGDLYEKTGRIRQAAAQWELSVAEYQKTPALDQEPGDMSKVEHKLESAHVRLAKQDSATGVGKPE